MGGQAPVDCRVDCRVDGRVTVGGGRAQQVHAPSKEGASERHPLPDDQSPGGCCMGAHRCCYAT